MHVSERAADAAICADVISHSAAGSLTIVLDGVLSSYDIQLVASVLAVKRGPEVEGRYIHTWAHYVGRTIRQYMRR